MQFLKTAAWRALLTLTPTLPLTLTQTLTLALTLTLTLILILTPTPTLTLTLTKYVEYARDANDLLALAQMSRTNGNGAAAAMDYLDRALVSLRGAGKALDRMVPLLPM